MKSREPAGVRRAHRQAEGNGAAVGAGDGCCTRGLQSLGTGMWAGWPCAAAWGREWQKEGVG